MVVEKRMDAFENRGFGMEPVVLTGDQRVKVGGKIEDQRGQREREGPQAAVSFAMHQSKMAPCAKGDRVFRHLVDLLHEAAGFTRNDRIHEYQFAVESMQCRQRRKK